MYANTFGAYALTRDSLNPGLLSLPFGYSAKTTRQARPNLNFRTAIISDMHLGRQAAFAEYLLEFLDNVHFDKLIINGDGFDGLNWLGNEYQDLPELHKRCIDAMFAFVARGGNLVYVPGNHDEEATIDKTIRLKDSNGHALEVKICERHHHIDAKGDVNLVMHGHQNDNWHNVGIMRKIANLADNIYEPALRLSQTFRKASINWLGVDVSLIAPLKFGVKQMVGVAETLRKTMRSELESGYFKRVICGHTHHAELFDDTANSGNFVEDGNFLAETHEGEWKLFKWSDVRKDLQLSKLPRVSDDNPHAEYREFTERAFAMFCRLYPKSGVNPDNRIPKNPEISQPVPEYAYA